jgi:hypothetical protein
MNLQPYFATLLFLDDDHVALSPCTKPCSFKFSTTCTLSLDEEIPICEFIWTSDQLVDMQKFGKIHASLQIDLISNRISHVNIYSRTAELTGQLFLIKWTCKLACKVESQEQKSQTLCAQRVEFTQTEVQKIENWKGTSSYDGSTSVSSFIASFSTLTINREAAFVNRQVQLAYLVAQSLMSFLDALSILATKLMCQTKKSKYIQFHTSKPSS